MNKITNLPQIHLILNFYKAKIWPNLAIFGWVSAEPVRPSLQWNLPSRLGSAEHDFGRLGRSLAVGFEARKKLISFWLWHMSFYLNYFLSNIIAHKEYICEVRCYVYIICITYMHITYLSDMNSGTSDNFSEMGTYHKIT